jgi:hypothetical protein
MIEEPELEERLRRERPSPAAGWRGSLRRQLLAGPPEPARPGRLWLRVVASSGLGVVLLALAALGV